MLTSSGPRVLSDACPKDADEIENLILSKRWPLPVHFVSPKCVGVSSLQLHGRLPAGNGTQEVCSASRCRMHQDLNVAKKLNRFFSPIFYRVQKQFAPWTRFPKDRGPTSAWKWDQISVLSISSDTTGGCNELRKEQAGFRIHWHIFGKLTIGMYFMFFIFTSDNWASPMKPRCCARAGLFCTMKGALLPLKKLRHQFISLSGHQQQVCCLLVKFLQEIRVAYRHGSDLVWAAPARVAESEVKFSDLIDLF